ncbi:hypothetical protein PRV_02365 [Mycoplasma parvum str. Indiana]|uniref:Uncharacterized protein n=1 Tax=Mycoplasma parvum str. Indiana TaxID=1403316 RepID=U5NCZ5_9MOLU|nr:hypothetical protein PRV_02365 [Mycoplasma parvum str. Indiana]
MSGGGATAIAFTTLYYPRGNQTVLDKNLEKKNEKVLSEYIEQGEKGKTICKRIEESGNFIPDAVEVDCKLISNKVLDKSINSRPNIWLWTLSDSFSGVLTRYNLLGDEMEGNIWKTNNGFQCNKKQFENSHDRFEISCSKFAGDDLRKIGIDHKT